MLDRMDKASQEKLLDALDHVSDLVENKSLHPNEAITKVAMEKQIPAGHVQLMVTAFNTGRANHHRKQASTVLDKAAPVPMADPAVILENLYPSKVKSAAARQISTVTSGDYLLPFNIKHSYPGMTKAAEVYIPAVPPLPKENSRQEKRAFNVLRDYEKLLSEKQIVFEKAKLNFMDSYKVACDTIRHLQPKNWVEIKNNITAAMGKEAGLIVKHVEAANQHIVKNAKEKTRENYDEKKSPYKELRHCVISMTTYRGAKTDLDKIANNAEFKKLKEFFLPEKKAEDAPKETPKPKAPGNSPGLMDSLFGGFGSSAKDSYKSLAPSLKKNMFNPLNELKLHDKVTEELMDPLHEHELRTIRTKAVVNDMLSNDPVLSEYDPKDVLSTFNELQRIAPRLMDEPSAVRVLLRKTMAQGGFDSHEINQISGTEKSIADSRKLPAGVNGVAIAPKLNLERHGYAGLPGSVKSEDDK